MRDEPTAEVVAVELTACPECGAPAEVEWRCSVDSTDGPIELVKVLCLRRHRFLLPATGGPVVPAG
jgi:hypothetical protein